MAKIVEALEDLALKRRQLGNAALGRGRAGTRQALLMFARRVPG